MPGNPMRDLLREQMAIDAFLLDGEATRPAADWSEEPQKAHSAVRLAPARITTGPDARRHPERFLRP